MLHRLQRDRNMNFFLWVENLPSMQLSRSLPLKLSQYAFSLGFPVRHTAFPSQSPPPPPQFLGDELRAIGRAQVREDSPPYNQLRQCFGRFLTPHPSGHSRGQALPRLFINQRQPAERPYPSGELIFRA